MHASIFNKGNLKKNKNCDPPAVNERDLRPRP